MRKDEILQILADWNFWDKAPSTGTRRGEYVEKALAFLRTNMILAITGARRSGKSFIMRQTAKTLIESGTAPKEILIVNFEDKRFVERTTELLDEIFEAYLEYVGPKSKPYVFVDEVHTAKGWERWARTMNELQKAGVVVSGSTSELISRELGTVLTGRHLDLKVFPLGFGEFLKFKNFEVKDRMDLLGKTIETKTHLREYLEYGGFPAVVLSNNDEIGTKTAILVSYFEDILTKDIVKRFGIKKISKLEALAKFYLSNTSGSITFRSAEKALGIGKDTVEKYSHYMEQAFLIFFIKRFSFSVKEQENSPRKVYSIDVGLSNAVGFRSSENFGKLMENVVAIELLRRKSILQEIFYWKDTSGKEVDFVLKDGLNVRELIQVCRDVSEPATKKRELGSLKVAMEKLKLDKGLVITEDFEGEETMVDGNKTITYTPLWKWLLEPALLKPRSPN